MKHSGAIRGISRTSLWNAWKEVRQQLKRAPRRDVLDYLEYDVDPDVWIKKLLSRIASSDYVPERPTRYKLAKSRGFDRIMTDPSVPDLVLYRAIVDYLFQRAKKYQAPHVYFAQSSLSKAVEKAEDQAVEALVDEKMKDDSPYPHSAKGSFLEWLRYDQYRKLLLFKKIYPYVVVTDIANFFDSVLYGRIEESLHELEAPSRMINLLFLLLESLSFREAFTPVQRIGLPVDSCDCSRVLAHMILFRHDERMIEVVGKEAYVRWMDDQNIGVCTYAEGLRLLSTLGDSLRRLHLTPNSSKTKILSLPEAKVHFHFAANRALDKMDRMPYSTLSERRALRVELSKNWASAKKYEGSGEWQKILKRFYRYGARARTRMFVATALRDVKQYPDLVSRVSDYLRYVATPTQSINFVESLIADPEQVYPSVNYQLVESLLLLYPDKVEAKRLCRLGMDLLSEKYRFPGCAESMALAPLLILRYGERRQINSLTTKLRIETDRLSVPVTRSICAVVGGEGQPGFDSIQDIASILLRNHLSEFVKFLKRISEFESVPGRFKARIDVRRDSITRAEYLDMRSLLAARLLGLAPNPAVRDWLDKKKRSILAAELADYDRKLIRRHWPK